MIGAEAVAEALVALGVDHVFGLVGSGNFHVTNALIARGARFVPSAHEAGAATMADAFARVSGRPTVVSVHQGPGFTNALTGLTEAAKSRTPLIALVPEATSPRSNFHLSLEGIARSIGAGFVRLGTTTAVTLDGTTILALPLDVQTSEVDPLTITTPPSSGAAEVTEFVRALEAARRPVFIAGRGATDRESLVRLADRCGALLATSAAAKGLFAGDPWNLDVSGGFASPLAASLIAEADLIVAWGSTLNMWTTRHGRLIGPHATVVQVDHDPAALAVNRPISLGVVGDVRATALAALDAVTPSDGWRTPELRKRIEAEVRWRDVSYVDESTETTIDPRTLSIALDDLLPPGRVIAVDSGNFMGYPSMYLSVADSAGFCFTQAFQSVGLGLASAIGAALARPDRLPVAALGDGGFLMSVAELTTVVRLGLPMVIVVYNDAAFGAEVHHFHAPLETVTFPDSDIAAIARGFGCAGLTVRRKEDLAGLRDWLDGPRETAIVIDAKVWSSRGSWWLEEAFR